ncbi:MAG: enoyl-CoA hydratase/isomerase family protein, partial [Planctomycetia bacterium]|nr:enoyl-CoA hydratase/isomerase family protein [Planctomycetia bacterium]
MQPFQTPNLRLEPQGNDRATLWLDVADKPVNVFSPQVLHDFDAALDHVRNDSACRLLILRSAKPSGFIAGADLNEFISIRSAAAASALSAQGQQLFDKLAGLNAVTLAVISGPCLGGGLECALACDYRLVVEHSKTQLALPEIRLGLLPGWGGTQRLPRVIGLEAALRVILGQKQVNAKEALRLGLADALASEADLPSVLQRMTDTARTQGKRRLGGLPLRTWRQKLLESNLLGRALLFRGTARLLRERVPDDMPAPWEALEAIRVGLRDGSAAGLAREREGIGRLATTPACRNLIGLFLHERARKASQPAGESGIRKVGVIGAGTMGAGIAQLAAIRGFDVVVREVNDAALTAGIRKIDGLFQKAVEHGIVPREEAARKLAAIGRTTGWQGFENADLVIEAALEDLEVKRRLFTDLEQHTRPTTVLATNTSSLLVANLQEGRQHPQRVGGLHFFNPVHKMPLVEVVRGPATDDATVAALTRFAVSLGKLPVTVKDSPGFLVNRILTPYLMEAVVVLDELRAVKRLDQLLRRFGMPVGPLELLDQVGLDIAAHVQESLRPVFEGRVVPNPFFEQFRREGWLGQKNGVGFYRYRGKSHKPNEAIRFGTAQSAPSMTPAQYRDRLVLLSVNEAAACLGEGIAADAETVDLAMVFGTGWAPHRGGPLQYADDRGIADIVRALEGLQQALGPRFEPCAELRRRAANGKPFRSLPDRAPTQPLAASR